jgi:hypothetical protein
MSYTAEISRLNPTCFIFMIDQSGSMADLFPDQTNRRKSDGVADAINNLLQNLVIKCSKAEGVRDYFFVSAIGYNSNSVGPAFGGSLSGKQLVPISEVALNPVRIDERIKKVEDGVGGLVDQSVRIPVWFDPMANGGTPMCQAARLVKRILESWLIEHPSSFPPVVIHITDGESTDGDPVEELKSIINLSSNDGKVILFNIHLSSNQGVNPVVFPNSSSQIPADQYAQMLFNTSSILTPSMISIANSEHGYNLTDEAKGFVLNADLIVVIKALDIGTRAELR